jgi:hypothetical protein
VDPDAPGLDWRVFGIKKLPCSLLKKQLLFSFIYQMTVIIYLYRVFHHLLASRDGKMIRHSFTQGGLSLTVRVNSMIKTMSMVLAPLESNAIKTICIVIVR